MSNPELEKNQREMGEMVESSGRETEKIPTAEKKVGKMKPVRNEIGEDKIDLVNDKGIKVGQAEGIGLVTTPDFLQKVGVDLDNKSEKAAMEAAQEVDDPEVVKGLVKEEISEQGLEGALMLVFMKFNAKCGGQVFESKKITMHDGRFERKSTESDPEGGKFVRNFIIPRSGAEAMGTILDDSVRASAGVGIKFDKEPYGSDVLGNEGFSYRLSATTPDGEKKQVEVNFYYGVEDGDEAVDSTEEEEQGDNVSTPKDTNENVTELHKKPEESTSGEGEEELPLAA